MTAKEFYQSVSKSDIDIVQVMLNILSKTESEYCVIGGLAVNAYVEPVVSLDLDIVVAAGKIDSVVSVAYDLDLRVERFEQSVNLKQSSSALRVQLQTDPRYQEFIQRAEKRSVLGYDLSVASLGDVLQGKVWAFIDETRRKSKRQKDLADIIRLIETYPELLNALPRSLRQSIE